MISSTHLVPLPYPKKNLRIAGISGRLFDVVKPMDMHLTVQSIVIF